MKINKIWKIGVVLAMLLSVFTLTRQEVKAETPGTDFTIDAATGTITKYTGSAADVVIPSVINGTEITTIGSKAFFENTTLKTVTIPATVTTIEERGSYSNGAFFNCTALTKVTILGPVTGIGYNSFSSCSNLTTIENTTAITSVGQGAFYQCNKLTTIKLGKLTHIGESAFNACSLLQGPIELAANITSIAEAAFWGCSSLTAIANEAPITSVGDYSFFSCNKLTNISLGKLTRIGERAFNACSLLQGPIKLDANITSIPNNAFANCNSLTAIANEAPITSVGNSGLSGCNKLTNISLGKLTSIGGNAFNGCYVLPGPIALAANITSIPNNVFTDCYNLTTIANEAPITSVGMGGLSGCSKLTTIDLGKLTNIDNSAFTGCTSLPKEKIKFADSLTSIGNNAFESCPQLTEITFPNSLKTIGAEAFKGCSLPYITLPDSVETVGDSAFGGQKSTGIYTVKNGISTYTFPSTMDVSKVSTTMTGVTIDAVNRTASSTSPLTSFSYTYTATNSNSVNAPVSVTVTMPEVPIVNATAPSITKNLSNTEIKVEKDTGITPLSVAATSTDGGIITYQWYSHTSNSSTGGTPITGATNTEYIPPIDTEGTKYYYCVVTNTNNGASINGATTTTTTTSVAIISVVVNAVAPIITNDLSTSEVKVLKGSSTSALNATATVSDGGTITYQWYSNTSNTVVGGTTIVGATSATYTPETLTAGTKYYYCEVTNNNAGVTGTKTAKTTSKVAMITVTKKAPIMIEGQDQSTYKGEEEELLFVSSADFTEFMEVQVDNQKINASYYDAEAGSIRITLKPEYLKTLAVGEHLLSILSSSGDVETTFVIKAREVKPQDPTIKPGDTDTGNAGNAGNTSNPTAPTETKKEVIDTSDTTKSMTGLFSMLVLAGVTMLGLRKKNNFE